MHHSHFFILAKQRFVNTITPLEAFRILFPRRDVLSEYVSHRGHRDPQQLQMADWPTRKRDLLFSSHRDTVEVSAKVSER